jgi:hypothetical protein
MKNVEPFEDGRVATTKEHQLYLKSNFILHFC